jgi:acyl carrier protein
VNSKILLEVGPGRNLTNLVKQTNPATPAIASLNGEHGSQLEHRSFLDAVGHLWQRGVEIDWMPLHEGREPSRVPLPAYSFDRKRHWIERRLRLGSAQPAAAAEKKQPEDQYRDPIIGVNGNGHGFQIRAELIEPQHDIEVRVLEIWRSFLGTQDIGVRQSFFEMGGDSLLATRLGSQIRQEFQIELPLAMMFELGTIRKLSLYIAVCRDTNLVDTLSEEDLDDVLTVMESWAARQA